MVHANADCKTAGVGSATTVNEATCRTNCKAKKAWGLDANSLPISGGTGTDYCFGYSWKTSNTACKFVISNLAGLVAGTGGDVGTRC